ncbi:MAG: 30S ribosomal protein S14 [Alphaproteobacteria bacterium]|jgi:small subunit ribosomal protein S14|nr:30S ribosomal protein S14 [Alphaproteobacteria bacterium]MBK9585684.1 30S ribosomal protein S14 [Alphaproteobacteria bacterium]MBP7758257.1 30S ribosomal protein S14 [Alphaproteobacteria bacterium]MBP7761600.1 30S ribosomal protein S14 [Alphaproteobacteria bacterium]MBP7904048.1 30S ribosomal protein S14 [Alphaproteobacteria bacterium]
MAKLCLIERDKKRRKLVKKLAVKRAKLKAAVRNLDLSAEERFEAMLKLAEMPRNSAKIRIRNRCQLTGRPRGNFRKFSLSRIALRDLAAKGQLPGVTKSSW